MSQPRTSGWVRLIALVVIIAVPAAIVLSYALAWFQKPVLEQGTTPAPGNVMNTPFIVPGLRLPPVVKAHDAELADDESVIGVSVEGRHRAYRVSGMTSLRTQVLNDLLGSTPVTVTYDNRGDRAQAFTDDVTERPLDVETGGYFNGLLLRVKGTFFLQSDGRFFDEPGKQGKVVLPTIPFTRTNWGEWRRTHPDTDIYVGLPAGADRGFGP